MSRQLVDSGINWLRFMPVNWDLIRTRYLCNITTGNKDTVNQNPEGKYPFYVRSESIKRIDTFSYDGEAVLTVGDGDIGKIFHYVVGKFDFHQRVYKFSDFNKVLAKYFYYYASSTFIKELDNYSAKTTVSSLRLPWIKDFPVCIPHVNEQQAIANFLDDKTEKIEGLIQIQETAIERLEEYKQSVIGEAVTKGLNPNVEMKESGIEWIGRIPNMYKVIKLSRGIVAMKDGTHGSFSRVAEGELFLSAKNVGESLLYISNNESMISKADQKEICKNGFPKKNDVLLTIVGTIGRSIVYPLSESLAFQRSVLFLRTNTLLNEKYLSYSLRSTYMLIDMMNRAKTSAQSGIYGKDVRELKLVLPLLEEQKSIVKYLDKKTEEVNHLIQIKKDKIEKLNEYKKSLIYEAVTGKIEVM